MSSLDKHLSRGYNSPMTKEQRSIIKKYNRIREINRIAVKDWRKRNPDYEKSPERRKYKKDWAVAKRKEKAQSQELNNSLQPLTA